MQTQIGRLEAHVEHIQFDVTDLRQDMKTILRRIGDLKTTPPDAQPVEQERQPIRVALHEFPDLSLIVKATTNVLYTNQAGGFACLHPEVEGFLVPLHTRFGRRELATLRNACSGYDDGIDAEVADELNAVLAGLDLKGVHVDRTKLAESWESWIHVTVADTPGYTVPLEGPRPDLLEAVLTWPNSD